jgi:ABC-type dipeptide/oligopeptide/nickel transport system permease subunit
MAKTKKSMGLRVWISLVIILFMTVIAFLAPTLSPHDPRKMTIGIANYPPAWYETAVEPDNANYILGSDLFGRDILSHVIYGTRAAMFLALIAIPLTALIGTTMGVIAGSGNRMLESILLRLTDVMSAVPSFMFAVILVFIIRATALGQVFGGLITLTIAFALVNWVSLARLVHTEVLKIRGQEFMQASRSLGAGWLHQIRWHILPHVSHLIMVWIVNNIPAVILLEALFGYIGIQVLQVTDGSSFQDLSWGGLILYGRLTLNRNPFMLFVPTICILIISLSFSILGEYLSERFNPQLDSSPIV